MGKQGDEAGRQAGRVGRGPGGGSNPRSRHIVCAVASGSPADRAGLLVGDRLVSINGEPVLDLIDYQYLSAGTQLTLSVERGGEGSPSGAEGTAPRSTKSVGVDASREYVGDSALSGGDFALAGGGFALSGGDPALSGGNFVLSGGDLTLPSGNLAAPVGDFTLSGGVPALTGGNPALSGGNPALSGGNPALSDGDYARPSGDSTLPGGNPASSVGDSTLPGCNPLQPEAAPATLTLPVSKKDYEPLGLSFAEAEEGGAGLMSPVRMCANRCVFCFVDQLAPGMRPSLRFKDDDWRMSLMMGNYVTLTNVSDAELRRIIARHASPLYISVHSTDGGVRARMMRNPHASRILDQLRALAGGGIRFHAQIVLCPGENDGDVLRDTIETLAALHPAARSLAVVPVGLTGHREGLYALRPLTGGDARAVLHMIHGYQRRFRETLKTAFVFAADELYVAAGEPLPDDADYEDYPQIENGVGLISQLFAQYRQAWQDAEFDLSGCDAPRRAVIITAAAAAPHLERLLREMPVPGVEAQVKVADNAYFGGLVNVAGLLTGSDIMSALKGIDSPATVLITATMLRREERDFLDGMTFDALREDCARRGISLIAVDPEGADLLDALIEARGVGNPLE